MKRVEQKAQVVLFEVGAEAKHLKEVLKAARDGNRSSLCWVIQKPYSPC